MNAEKILEKEAEKTQENLHGLFENDELSFVPLKSFKIEYSTRLSVKVDHGTVKIKIGNEN